MDRFSFAQFKMMPIPQSSQKRRYCRSLLIAAIFGILSVGHLQSQANTVTVYDWVNTDIYAQLPGYQAPSGTLYIDSDNPGVAAPGSVFDFGVGILGIGPVDLTGASVHTGTIGESFPVLYENAHGGNATLGFQVLGATDSWPLGVSHWYASPTLEQRDNGFRNFQGEGKWVIPGTGGDNSGDPVPDGGLTVLLMAISLSGVFGFQRLAHPIRT